MKINDIQKKEWFELASFDDNILKDGLLEIGLTKNEISKIKSQFGNYKKENLPEEIVKPSQGENIGPAGVGVACTASALGCTASAIARGACLVGGSLGYLFDLKKKEDKEFELKNKLSDFLKERLGFLKFETKSEIVINVKIPLFKWNSPMVEGSEILYETKNTESLDNTFGLTIFGLGLGKTYKLSFSSSNSFICSNGSFKQIYIPVVLKASLVNVKDKQGSLKKQFVQTELVLEEDVKQLDIGIEELTIEDFNDGIIIRENFQNYFLAGDKSKSIHTFQKVFGEVKNYEYPLGIEVFNIKTSCKTRISRNNEVKLTFKLLSGHDYRVLEIMDGLGLYWK